MAERLLWEQEDVGSTPASPTMPRPSGSKRKRRLRQYRARERRRMDRSMPPGQPLFEWYFAMIRWTSKTHMRAARRMRRDAHRIIGLAEHDWLGPVDGAALSAEECYEGRVAPGLARGVTLDIAHDAPGDPPVSAHS